MSHSEVGIGGDTNEVIEVIEVIGDIWVRVVVSCLKTSLSTSGVTTETADRARDTAGSVALGRRADSGQLNPPFDGLHSHGDGEDHHQVDEADDHVDIHELEGI